MNEYLFPKLCVLQGPNGHFGPTVIQKILSAGNQQRLVKWRNKFKVWFKDCFFPFANRLSSLLLDSWLGYNDTSVLEPIPEKKHHKNLKLPSGTTGYMQPLDREFFRQWKCMNYQLSEKICYECVKFELRSEGAVPHSLSVFIAEVYMSY